MNVTSRLNDREQRVLRRIGSGEGHFTDPDVDMDYDAARSLQQQRLVKVAEVELELAIASVKATLKSITFELTHAGREIVEQEG